MRISTRGRYGLRAMVELARNFGNGPLLMRAITERQGIPRKYLHAILTALRSRGLVKSVRGSHGGYALGRPPDQITTLEIVRALEGEILLVDCAESGQQCVRFGDCATRDLWADVGRAIEERLASVTLAELAQRGKPAGAAGIR
jgi:Rrf2 family cysteine metabolism transcriptional repressor